MHFFACLQGIIYSVKGKLTVKHVTDPIFPFLSQQEEEEELLDESEKSVDPLHMVKPDEGNGESAVNMASESSEGDQATEGALVTDDVIKNDIQWGRKSLLQFILNLGFQNNQLS